MSFTKLFDSSVSPVLAYASEIWRYKENIQCDRIHQRASRYYMGVHPKTHILVLIGDLGCPHLKSKDTEI